MHRRFDAPRWHFPLVSVDDSAWFFGTLVALMIHLHMYPLPHRDIDPWRSPFRSGFYAKAHPWVSYVLIHSQTDGRVSGGMDSPVWSQVYFPFRPVEADGLDRRAGRNPIFWAAAHRGVGALERCNCKIGLPLVNPRDHLAHISLFHPCVTKSSWIGR